MGSKTPCAQRPEAGRLRTARLSDPAGGPSGAASHSQRTRCEIGPLGIPTGFALDQGRRTPGCLVFLRREVLRCPSPELPSPAHFSSAFLRPRHKLPPSLLRTSARSRYTVIDSASGYAKHLEVPIAPHNVDVTRDGVRLLAAGVAGAHNVHAVHGGAKGRLVIIELAEEAPQTRSMEVGGIRPMWCPTRRAGSLTSPTRDRTRSSSRISRL